MIHMKTALTIFDLKINICNLFNERILMRFVKPIVEEYQKNSNFKFKCPFKKVRWNLNHSFLFSFFSLQGYYLIKKTILPELFIPSFIQRNDVYFSSFDFMSKINKKMENMFFLSLNTEVIEIDD